MFCPNCGHKINENEDFCSECGTQVAINSIQGNTNISKQNINNDSSNNQETLSEQLAKNNPLLPLLKKIKILFGKGKDFVLKHKKPFSLATGCLILIIISIILFNNLYDFTKLSWDNENGDSSITHTEPTTLTLNVLAFDKDRNKITDIKFSTKNGEIQSDGTTVKWKLPEEKGTYTIIAEAPSGKKITKEVKVVSLNDNDEYQQFLSGMIEIPEDDETTDSDNDGLTNAKEKELGTNPYSADSDGDGLPDKLEIERTKTDPLKKDTDGDGINDGDELDLGLDPLKIDSKEDGIKDSDRTLTYSLDKSKLGVSMQIMGKGNIASITIDKIKNSTFADMDGLMDTVYNFYTSGTIQSAIVTIKYNIEDITSKGLDENNLTLYYFNEDTKELEALPTVVDVQNKTITVTLKHFSKYVIGDSNVVLANYNSQIMFVIDNSVSMYSMTQMIEAGYGGSTGAVGNDIDFKRLTLTNKMVEKFTGNYQFGVAEFSGNYVNLSQFTDNVETVKKAVNTMKSHWNSNASGTNIISALKNGINEFKEDENGHYVVLLTDGKNTEGSLSSNKNTIISQAKEKNVKICVIGLGSDIDTNDLDNIAESTGCDYYNATDSSALDEIYSIVGANINYSLVDTDNDNKTDGMIQANSGFIVTRDGFSFSNFSSNKSENGHCYGMATFAMLYYKNQLPTTLSAKDNSRFYLTAFKTINLSSNGYNLSNTYFSKHNALYDYKITNKALDIFLNDNPADYRDRVENSTWMIKKEYYDIMSKIGATFSIKDYKGGDEDFTKYQSALLNIDSDPFNTEVVKDESQLIDAIWRLYILQANAKKTSFNSDPDKAFNELYSQLNDGTPLVIGLSGAGNHAINAIRLIQDTNDANKYKIEVYDNNYPGETRYIEVTRSKYSKFVLDYTAWTNEYNYEFKYDMDDDGTMEDISVRISYPEIN